MTARLSMKTGILLAALALALLTAGCRGMIYTRTVEPLDVNLSKTPCDWYPEEYAEDALSWFNIRVAPEPAAGRTASGNIKHIAYDIYDARWDSNAIGDLARRDGLETIYFADMETLRVLFVFSSYTAHVYGR